MYPLDMVSYHLVAPASTDPINNVIPLMNLFPADFIFFCSLGNRTGASEEFALTTADVLDIFYSLVMYNYSTARAVIFCQMYLFFAPYSFSFLEGFSLE